MKKIIGVYSAPRPHWVGDGFRVHTLFSYGSPGLQISPFLMLDYAAPAQFDPSARRRGVGEHPHRGFETVTIVYQGEVEHRDSTGAGGHIGPGDVQWMTAGAGILHEEFHSQAFSERGGTMEMVQLWVNLKAQDKRAAPGYQTLLEGAIPVVELAAAAGRLRVIAGDFNGHRGPARTFTPINLWDIHLESDRSALFVLPEGHTLALVVLHGSVTVNASQTAGEAQMVLFEHAGSRVSIAAVGAGESGATILLLGGEPIDEPIVGHGPFVMNTQAEIDQAIADFNSGRFGRILG